MKNVHTLLLVAALAQIALLFSCAQPQVKKESAEYTEMNALCLEGSGPACAFIDEKLEEPDCMIGKVEGGEDCENAWYVHGDATGDYGPIDAAE